MEKKLRDLQEQTQEKYQRNTKLMQEEYDKNMNKKFSSIFWLKLNYYHSGGS